MPWWIAQGALLTFAIFFAVVGRLFIEWTSGCLRGMFVWLTCLAWVVLITDVVILIELVLR